MTGIQGLQPLCPRETITQTRQTEREILLVASSSLNFRPQTDWNQEREKEERRRGAKREGDKDKEGEREKRNAENRRKKKPSQSPKDSTFLHFDHKSYLSHQEVIEEGAHINQYQGGSATACNCPHAPENWQP